MVRAQTDQSMLSTRRYDRVVRNTPKNYIRRESMDQSFHKMLYLTLSLFITPSLSQIITGTYTPAVCDPKVVGTMPPVPFGLAKFPDEAYSNLCLGMADRSKIVLDGCGGGSCSGHTKSGMIGRPQNTAELDEIFLAMGFDRILGAGNSNSMYQNMIKKLQENDAYNPGQDAFKQWLGIYPAYSTAAKLCILPATNFKTWVDAAKAYGGIKRYAMECNIGQVKRIIRENGGNSDILNSKQLLALWATNEHMNLHAILFGSTNIKHTIHITSLNDDAEGHTNVCPKGWCGGFNDKGQWPENDHWFTEAGAFPQRLGINQCPNAQSRGDATGSTILPVSMPAVQQLPVAGASSQKTSTTVTASATVDVYKPIETTDIASMTETDSTSVNKPEKYILSQYPGQIDEKSSSTEGAYPAPQPTEKPTSAKKCSTKQYCPSPCRLAGKRHLLKL